MKHESHENSKIQITDGMLFSEIYQKSYIPINLIDEIKEADILLLPYEGFRIEMISFSRECIVYHF